MVLHQLLLAAAVLDEDLYITQGVRNGLNVRSDLLKEVILQVSTCQRVEHASNSALVRLERERAQVMKDEFKWMASRTKCTCSAPW